MIVALSAHAFPPDEGRLERMVSWFEDDTVACAYGQARDESGAPLPGPMRQDAGMLERNPSWGYPNSAGGLRAELWRERPFREDMPGTETREWSRWALGRGGVCVLDPSPPYTAGEALDDWWGDQGRRRSRARARLDPRRMARLAGKWKGRR